MPIKTGVQSHLLLVLPHPPSFLVLDRFPCGLLEDLSCRVLVDCVTPRPLLVPPAPHHLPESRALKRAPMAPGWLHLQQEGVGSTFPGWARSVALFNVLNASGQQLLFSWTNWEENSLRVFLGMCPFWVSTRANPCPSVSSRQWFNDFAKVPFEKVGFGGFMHPTKSHILSFFPFLLFVHKTLMKEWWDLVISGSNNIRNLWAHGFYFVVVPKKLDATVLVSLRLGQAKLTF